MNLEFEKWLSQQNLLGDAHFVFEEAITCHMATRSYLEGRKVEWDPIKKKIV